jgi:hypothetical protein
MSASESGPKSASKSSWLDGLMRSSGLPLGAAPVIGFAPSVAAPALEDMSSVAPVAAAPRLDASASAAEPTRAPASPRAPFEARPEPPAARREGLASRLAEAPSEAPAPLPEAGKAAGREDLPPSSAEEPSVSMARVLQGVMRWIAAASREEEGPGVAPPQAPAETADSPAPIEAPSRTRRSPGIRPVSAQPAGVDPRPPAQTFAAEAPPPVVAAEQAQPPVAAAPVVRPHPHPQARSPEPFELSIGGISLEIEAPAPPPLRVAERARPPSPRAAPPRSGLSRRALRGF